MTSVQQHDGAIEPTVNAQCSVSCGSISSTCRLMPNERLRVESLRERYGVGGSPIREALMRLEVEGLVILEQNKGFRVSPASREHLLDLMKTRVEIEGLALRWSIENGGVDWEANLSPPITGCRTRKRSLRGTGNNEINRVWFREHRNFHCRARRRLRIAAPDRRFATTLFAQAERYVALSIISKCPPRNDDREHEQMMRAALARNAVRAVQMMTDHIDHTNERVAKTLGAAAAQSIKLRRVNGKA